MAYGATTAIKKNKSHHDNYQNHNPNNLPVFEAAAAAVDDASTAAAAAVAADFIRVSGDRGYAPFLFIVQHVMCV